MVKGTTYIGISNLFIRDRRVIGSYFKYDRKNL